MFYCSRLFFQLVIPFFVLSLQSVIVPRSCALFRLAARGGVLSAYQLDHDYDGLSHEVAYVMNG
jgi:hypothetical protein